MRWIRRSVRKKAVFIFLFLVVQVAFFFVCQTTVKGVTVKKYEAILQEKDAVFEAAGRIAYITKKEVKAGEFFSEENVEKKYLLSEQNPEALAQDVLGRRSCADISEGVIVNTALCSKEDYAPSERQCVFHKIGFAECFAPYSVVDVRIRYANGENYCVLKKKSLQRVTDDLKECSFFLTEEEQLLMSAAQYDVEIYEGAELYLVGFREERLQEDAISAYLPSVQILTQLKEWEGEYKQNYESGCRLRNALEERLLAHRKLQLNELW